VESCGYFCLPSRDNNSEDYKEQVFIIVTSSREEGLSAEDAEEVKRLHCVSRPTKPDEAEVWARRRK